MKYLADRGLGHVQRPGGGADRASPVDGVENLNLAKAHALIFGHPFEG